MDSMIELVCRSVLLPIRHSKPGHLFNQHCGSSKSIMHRGSYFLHESLQCYLTGFRDREESLVNGSQSAMGIAEICSCADSIKSLDSS